MEQAQKIFIPELRIHRIVSLIIEAIREDLIKSPIEETFLFQVLQDSKADGYELYEQMKEVFLRKRNDSRYLDVRLFFDAKRAEIPTIHVNLPQETKGEDGLGSDEGFAPTLFDDNKLEYVRQYNRRFNANYQVLITSNNSLEVIGLYHILRAAIIANLGSLETLGFTNLSLGGGDLQLNPDIIPVTVFVRGINFNFGYEVTAPAIKREKFYTKIFEKIKPIIS